jgi:TniQ
MTDFKIAVRPIPYFDETATSVIARAAELNGHVNLYHMLRGSGILYFGEKIESMFSSKEKYERITKFIGVCDISTRVIAKGGSVRRRREFDGVHIPDNIFRLSLSAYCPQCLREAAYWRKNWLLRPYTVCSMHNSYLYESCGHCSQQLEHDRSFLCICSGCEKDIRDLPIIDADSSVSEWFINSIYTRNQEVINDYLIYYSVFTGSGSFKLDSIKASVFAYYCITNIRVAAEIFIDEVKTCSKTIHPIYFLCPMLNGYERTKKVAKDILSYLDLDYLPLDCPGLNLKRRELIVLLSTDQAGLDRLTIECVLSEKATRKSCFALKNFNFLMQKILQGSTSVSTLLGLLSSRNGEYYSISQGARLLGVPRKKLWDIIKHERIKLVSVEIAGFIVDVIPAEPLHNFRDEYKAQVTGFKPIEDFVLI